MHTCGKTKFYQMSYKAKTNGYKTCSSFKQMFEFDAEGRRGFSVEEEALRCPNSLKLLSFVFMGLCTFSPEILSLPSWFVIIALLGIRLVQMARAYVYNCCDQQGEKEHDFFCSHGHVRKD